MRISIDIFECLVAHNREHRFIATIESYTIWKRLLKQLGWEE